MGDLRELFEEHFRHRHARLTARLVRSFGPASLELVEDALQEAMARALRRWPYEGVPERPEAWLARVARNLVLDAGRREGLDGRSRSELGRRTLDETDREPDELDDDRLRMIFVCCHPSLSPSSRVALTLKCACGLGTGEVARGLLLTRETTERRLSRAKATLRAECVDLAIPSGDELRQRLGSVLDVIYLVFNEGYAAHAGEDLVRRDLMEEALQLCGLLLDHPETAEPRVHALAALMLFLGARTPARVDALGGLTVLADQDRGLWRRDWTALAWEQFRLSLRGEELTAFHVEAAIASCHAAARDYPSTDWPAILEHYDRLVLLTASPTARLNRAVAVYKVRGVREALAELESLASESVLRETHLLPATRGMILWASGDPASALPCFEKAAASARTRTERALLEDRAARCRRGETAPPI